jgi:hypothetical protein
LSIAALFRNNQALKGETGMAKRGRPRKSTSLLAKRRLYALNEYDKGRAAGEKHSEAVRIASEEVQRKYPHLKISQTEIKEMLAEWRGPSKGFVLFCKEIDPDEHTAVMPKGERLRFSLQVRLEQRPDYSRHNAVSKSES